MPDAPLALSPDIVARAAQIQQQAQAAQAAQAQAAQQQAAADAAAADAANRNRSNTWGEAASNLVPQTLMGAVNLGQAAYGVANMASLGVLDRATGFSNNFQQTNQILQGMQSEPTQQAIQNVDQAFDKSLGQGALAAISSPAYLQQAIVPNALSMLPAAAGAGLAARTAQAAAVAQGLDATAARALVEKATERGVMTSVAGQVGGTNNVDAINQIQAAGGSENQKQGGGLVAGALAGVAAPVISKLSGAAHFEGQAFNALLGGAEGRAGLTPLSVVGGALKGAAHEALEEGPQSASEQMAQNLVTPGTPIMQGVGKQAIIGAGVGALIGGGMGGALSIASPSKNGSALEQQTQQALAQANQEAGSPLTAGPLSGQTETQQAAGQTLQAIAQAGNEPQTSIPLPDGSSVPGTAIDLGHTPLPEDNIDIGAAAPVPTGMASDDLTPYQRNQLRQNGMSDDQLGSLSTTDGLAALALQNVATPPTPEVTEQPTGEPESINLGDTPVPNLPVSSLAPAGLPTVSVVPGPSTWKQSLVKDLNLKPGNLQAKDWAPVQAAIEGAGFHPIDPRSASVLKTVANQLQVTSDPATRSLAVSRLIDKYADPLPEEQPTAQAQPEQAPVAEVPAVANQAPAEPQPVPQTKAQIKRAQRDAAKAAEQAVTQQEATQVTAEAIAPVRAAQPATPGSPATVPQFPVDKTIKEYMRLDDSIDRPQAAADAYSDAIVGASNTGDLDQVYIGIKNHTDWTTLSKAQQDQVTNDFDLQYARMEKGESGRFDRARTPVAAPIADTEFQTMIRAANNNRPASEPEVVPVESVADFEALTGHAAPPDARGVFADGKAYLIRQNVPDSAQLALTLAHERGHAGLQSLLGDRLDAVLNRLWTNPAMREKIKSKMQDLSSSGTPNTGSLRRLAAEEVLADQFASGQPVAKDIITKARAAIEATFARILGVGDMRMNNADVEALLRDVSATLQGQSPTSTHLGYPSAEDLPGMLADPAPWVTGDARFDRATTDMAEITRAAMAENGGTTRDFAAPVKAVYAASLDKLGNIGRSTLADKARAVALNTLPLNSIAHLYPNLFSGKLTELSREKRAKESKFTRLLTAKQDLKFQNDTHTTSPQQLTHEWGDYNRKNPAKGAALNAVQQTGTLYRLFPNKPYVEQSVYDPAQGYTEAERMAAHKDLQKAWAALGPDGQAIWNKSQAVYSNMWNTRYEALRKAVGDQLGDTAATLHDEQGNPVLDENDQPLDSTKFKQEMNDRIDNAIGKLSLGPYSPLTRWGDYMVTVRKDGKTFHLSGHDTIEQGQKQQLALRSQFPEADGYTIAGSLRRDNNFDVQGLGQGKISTIERVVSSLPALQGEDKAPLVKQITQGLVEAHIQSLPQGSFLQHANSRKNIAGANNDAYRGYNDYTIKAARSIASLNHDGAINRYFTSMQNDLLEMERAGTKGTEAILAGRVLNAARQQHAASQTFERSAIADLLTGAGFLMYLSSPSQLLINASQTAMVTIPRMAAAYGSGGGIKAMRGAMAQFAKSRGDLLGKNSVIPQGSNEQRLLQELQVRGALDFSATHDMTALAQGGSSALSGHYRKMMEVAGLAMQKSEVFNRQVAAHATIRAELEKLGGASMTDADFTRIANAAEDMVYTTQGDYSQSNAPKIMQGPWRKVIFQFQKYRMMQLANLGKDVRDVMTGTPEEKATARRALAWQLGMQLTLTGALGTVLAPMVFGLADLFRDKDDLLDSKTDFARHVPQILAHGLLSNFVDLSRAGQNNLFSVGGDYAPQNASPKDLVNYYATANVPAIGLISNTATGIQGMLEGDPMKTAKGLAPAGIRDVIKAYLEGQQGAKDGRGVMYYDPSIYDGFVTAMGLRSGDRAQAEELRGAAYEANANLQFMQKRALGTLAAGYAQSDTDMIADGQSQLADLRQSFPDIPIKGVAGAIVNRIRAQNVANQYGYDQSKAPSQSMREILGQ